MSRLTLKVPDMSCGHCVASISASVGKVPGVQGVDVDLGTKRVEVAGEGLDPAAVAVAVRDAGYEPERS